MSSIAVVTTNDETALAQMTVLPGTNLVGARIDFLCWEWDNPQPADVTTVEAMAEYKGTIPLD